MCSRSVECRFHSKEFCLLTPSNSKWIIIFTVTNQHIWIVIRTLSVILGSLQYKTPWCSCYCDLVLYKLNWFKLISTQHAKKSWNKIYMDSLRPVKYLAVFYVLIYESHWNLWSEHRLPQLSVPGEDCSHLFALEKTGKSLQKQSNTSRWVIEAHFGLMTAILRCVVEDMLNFSAG